MIFDCKRRYSFILFLTFSALFIFSDNVMSQEMIILPNRDVPIPTGYKTWSLFLINNPEWILPEKNENLDLLFEQFKAFGDAIGPENLAVWFWVGKSSDPWDAKPSDIKDVDFLRSSAFCSQLKLPASKSPYILITTEYPGEGLLSEYPKTFNALKNYSLVELNSLSAEEITSVLNNIADQLLTADISRIKVDTEDYWLISLVFLKNSASQLIPPFLKRKLKMINNFASILK